MDFGDDHARLMNKIRTQLLRIAAFDGEVSSCKTACANWRIMARGAN